MKTKQSIINQLLLCAGLFLLAGAYSLQAGTDTWNGAGADNNWNTIGNWTAGSANKPPIGGDALVFDGSTRLTANNNQTAINNYAGILFSPTAGAFTLTGNQITNTAAIADSSPNLETVNLNMVFTSTHTINAAAGGTMAINGVISGAGGITKTGGGTITFSGSSPQTYTGASAINAGTLTLDYVTGSPGPNIINKTALSLGGGTLNLVGNGTVATSSNLFAGTTFASGLSTISGSGSASAALAGLTYTAGAAVKFVGPATSTGISSATGQTGANGNADTTGLVASTATVSTTAGAANATVQGGATGIGATGSAAQAAFATVGLYDVAIFSGTSPFSIIGGSQGTGGTAGDGVYTVASSNIGTTTALGCFDIVASLSTSTSTSSYGMVRFNTPAAITFNIRTVFSAQGFLITPNVGANNTSFTGSGSFSYGPGGRSGVNAGSTVFWQNNTLGFFSINVTLGDDGNKAGSAFVQAGLGTVAYNNPNTYTGQTYLDGGYSLIGTGATNGAFGAQGTAANLNLNGGTVVANGTMVLDNAGANKRPIVLGNNGGGLAAITANTLTVDGVISGSGALTVGLGTLPGTGAGTANTTALTGDGIVNLSGTDTFSGSTFVNNGTLALASTGTIGSTPQITTAAGATFDVSAVSGYTLGASQSLAGSGTVNGSVNTTSGSIIYAGKDGTFGTNTFNNNLTNVSGALITLDLGTVYNGSNDLISVGGTLALNSTVFHLKAPNSTVNLDTNADYVLATAAAIAGTPNTTPVWDVAPANAANYIVTLSGNKVVLSYSASAPPSGAGYASPNPVNRNQSTRITVVTVAGSNPVGSVVLDASLIGGSSSVTLVQSNSTSVYTNTVTVSAGTAPGIKGLSATIYDTTSPTPLSAVITINLTVVNTQTWDGLAADDNWSSGLNWVSTVSPVTGDYLIFAGSTRPTPSMDADNNMSGLAFAGGAASFTVGTPGNSLTLSGSGITNNSANLQTLNLPITLTAAQTINAAAGILALSQAITNGGNLLSFDGITNTVVSGAITGAGGLNKNGSGTVTLLAANTYSGSTTVAAGILEVTNNGAISGAVASVSAVGGAELLVDGGLVTATSGNVGVPSTGLFITSGTVNYSGALNMDFGVNNNSVINVAGGTLTAGSMAFGRTGLSNTTQPTSGDTIHNLYIHAGGVVMVTNNLSLSTSALANSSVNARIDSGSLTVGGVLTIGLNNSGRWSDLDVNGGTVTVNDTTTGIDIGGPLAGNAVLLLRNGTANAGKISFGQATAGSTNMNAVLSLTGSSLYVGSGGMAQVSTGAGFVSTVNLTGGTLGAGADWSSTMNMTLGAATIKAADAANAPHTITLSGILSGGSLTKTGNGNLILGGANTYPGATAINAGTLTLTNDGVTYFGALPTSTITVATNATFDVTGLAGVGGFTLGSGKTVAGVGTVVGTFAAVDNSTISPAGTGAQGALNFANGLAATNTTFKLELGNDPTGVSVPNDAIHIAGDLNIDGSNNVVVVPVGSLAIGTYKLITYTGSFYGAITNLSCVAGDISTNTPGEIDLVVTTVRAVASLVWRGDGVANLWDTGGASNWLNGASSDRFYTGDTVTFDDTATSFTANLSGILTPAAAGVITVNAVNDYDFAGSGDLSGSTGLTKTNTGKLTIENNQAYTGVTTINGGAISVSTLASGGSASPIGAASASASNLILDGGALEYLGVTKSIDRAMTLGAGNGGLSVVSSGTTLTLSGQLTGPGTLIKTGDGQVTLNGGNNYAGGTLIKAGTIRANPASGLGTNVLTLNGTTSTATFLFGGDSQTLSDVLNVVDVNNYITTAGNDTINKITGSGTVNLNGSGAQTLTLAAIDSSAFTGTFMGNTLPFLRFTPTSGTTLNASNATFNLGYGSTQLINRDGGTYSLGALAGGGSTYMKGSANSGSAATTYTIGGNNTDADFSGIIATGAGGSGAKVNIVKVGTGRQTFSGVNTYNGTTTITAGVLALSSGGPDGSFNNTTPITINSNAVLDVSLRSDHMLTLGNSQTLQGQGTLMGSLTAHGTVTPDPGTAGLVNTNTVMTLDGGTLTVGSNLTLNGHGLINGSLIVNGTVTPGTSAATAKLSVTNAVTLGGTAYLKLNRTASPHCDSLVCSNTMLLGGTLTIVNLGDPLQAGDTFTLFSAGAGISGTFAATNLPSLDTGKQWTNASSGVWSVYSTVNLTPTNLTTTVSGTTLTISWPPDHTGWRLLEQTSNLATGVSANPADWTEVAGSASVNTTDVTIDPTLPTKFYRLVYP